MYDLFERQIEDLWEEESKRYGAQWLDELDEFDRFIIEKKAIERMAKKAEEAAKKGGK